MSAKLNGLIKNAISREAALPPLSTPLLHACICLLVVIGFAVRLSPLLDMEGRLFWQHMTEDGYLMQTVARNMAIGLGMSTSEGTIPTNGVQPLATFFFAALHFLAGGSKSTGIVLVTLFSTAISAMAALYAFKVIQRVYGQLAHSRELAMVTAALWFAAPLIIAHSMNGLETGVYYLAILFALNYYLAATASETHSLSWKQRLLLGIVLGIAFLARNDAVFFIAGILGAHLLLGGATAGSGYSHRFRDCMTAGFVSVGVALPWLAHNYLLFGSIIPISGTAQSHNAGLGQNLAFIPANLFENTFLFAPLPRSLETLVPVILICLVCVAAILITFRLFAVQSTLASRRYCFTGMIFGMGVVVYYGVFFGAPHFIPRYTSPLSLFLWPAAVSTIYLILCFVCRSGRLVARGMSTISVFLLLGASTFGWSDFTKGRSHPHKQVVNWTQKNVSDRQWVGAVQTGTLGYFHDRTINLDGKVNPDALRAKIREGHVINYVLASKIDYVIDWAGVAGWIGDGKYPLFSREFEIAVNDRQLNLAVLRRLQPVKEN